MDTFSSEKRSNIMSKVLSKDTKPEIIVRKFLFSRGFRYRKNVNTLAGKPDIVLAKYKTIIFIHGCFWHGHVNCPAYRMPKSNIEYWQKKISTNIERDIQNINSLKSMGWNIVIVWECELKKKSRNKRLEALIKQITE